MPRLHRAKTVAWGLLKWGRCAWMVCVHSVTRGWQDILFLLGCMGYMATHTTPAGRHVLPLCIAGRNIIDSKTYPRKLPPTPPPSEGGTGGGWWGTTFRGVESLSDRGQGGSSSGMKLACHGTGHS